MIEWYEDQIEVDPMAAHSQKELDAGLRTGDAVVDVWEKKVAKGKGSEIDFAADLGLDAAKLDKWLKGTAKEMRTSEQPLAKPIKEPEESVEEGFSDKYTEE